MKLALPILTLALAAVAVAAQFIPGTSGFIEFDRVAISHGEWWRLLTAHLAHFDPNHLTWDVTVFFALGWACERESRSRCAIALALAGGAITTAVYWLQPRFEIYRGLSGLDCALFGLFAGSLLRRSDALAKLVGGAALLAVVAKTSAEISTGSTVFAAGLGYSPVPLAHLVGVVVGVASAWWRDSASAAAMQSIAQSQELRDQSSERTRAPSDLKAKATVWFFSQLLALGSRLNFSASTRVHFPKTLLNKSAAFSVTPLFSKASAASLPFSSAVSGFPSVPPIFNGSVEPR
ncbi:MAG: rhombosortase [Opitutus sp.]|nr:rhombosortase [Opitutus sp.]